MQISKSVNPVKLPGVLLWALLLTTLFSCSKTTEEIAPVAVKNASTGFLANQSRDIVNSVPLDRTYYVSCANGGNGEDVQLTGNLNYVHQLVVNDNRFTYTYHINPQGLTGLGLSSGESFVASGGSQGTQSGFLVNNQFTTTFTEQLRIVGAGSTFIVRYKFHLTITAGGVYTTSISDDQADCRTL